MTTGRALTEVASGVDALYLSGRTTVPDGLATELGLRREDARSGLGPVIMRFGGERVEVTRGGIPPMYPYRLQHDYGSIGVAPDSKAPAIRVQPLASHLHAFGVRQAITKLTALVEAELGPVVWSVNRLDLFADTQGWSVDARDLDRFVRRPKAARTNHDGGEFTGFEFGRRKGGAIVARLYDKTHEIEGNGHDWWRDAWSESGRYVADERVLRMEFEVRTAALGEFGVRSIDDALDNVGGVWGYCTDSWLTFRDRTDDQTRDRWPVSPEWQAMQAASLRGAAVALDRVHETERSFALEKMMPAMFGYLASFAGVTGTTSIDGALDALRPALKRYEVRAGKDFNALAISRRPRLGST